MNYIRRKPVFTICEQQRCRSACTSVQSGQRLCYSLHRWYNTSNFYIQNFKPLASFCGCTGQFYSTLVSNLEDRFSCDEVEIITNYRPYLFPWLATFLLLSCLSEFTKALFVFGAWKVRKSCLINYRLNEHAQRRMTVTSQPIKFIIFLCGYLADEQNLRFRKFNQILEI